MCRKPVGLGAKRTRTATPVAYCGAREGLAGNRSSPGHDGRSLGRTQGASISVDMGATEDGARGRAARPGGTDCFPPNPPSSVPSDPPQRGCLLALAPAHELRLVILVALFVLALLRRAGRRLQLARPFAELSRQTRQPAALAVISLPLFSHPLSS